MSSRQPTEKEQARFGPRALKAVGSAEWCWQTVGYLKDSLRHVEEQWRESEAVLDDLVKAKAWKVIPPGQPYGSLDKMLEAEVGLNEQDIKARIRDVQLTGHGGDRRSEQFQDDNINLKTQGGTSESYIVRRLKRDRPDLAELVLDGKVSARAAGIAAGFIKRTATVPIDDPDRLAATLRRRLKREDLARLAELLRGDP